MNTEPGPISVTIIHGTWARGILKCADFDPNAPRWFEPGGQFFRELETALKTEGFSPSMRTFYWSGANSLLARDEAARRLAEDIESTSKFDPDARHLLVGHSHGGAVILRALARLPRQDRRIFVATIATPFLKISADKISRLRKTGLFFLLLFSIGIPLQIFFSAGFEEFVDDDWAVLAAAAVTLWICLRATKRLLNETRWRQLVANTSDHPPWHGPTFVVRTKWDEATLGIGLGNIAEMLSTCLRALVTALILILTAIILILAYYGLAELIGANAHQGINGVIKNANELGARFLIALVLIVVVEGWRTKLAIVGSFLLFAAAFRSVNGRELGTCILGVRARVSGKPHDAPQAEGRLLEAKGMLAHSLYANPLVATRIAQWLSAQDNKT